MIDVSKLSSEYLDNLNPKNVLDLGCGKGRMSLRYSKKGINVLGVDKKYFEFKKDSFKFMNQDIKEFKFDDKYDLIISSLILHFFKKDNAIKILKDIKANTKKGGYNFFIFLSKKDPFFKKENFFPDLKEILKIYSDWKLVRSDEGYTDVEEHDNLKSHKHHLLFFLFQKP